MIAGDAAGGCRLRIVGTASVTVYMRPRIDAEIFSTLSEGDIGEVLGRTDDGWYGIDPGIAQADNHGLDRLRWVAGDAAVVAEGSCDAVPRITDDALGRNP